MPSSTKSTGWSRRWVPRLALLFALYIVGGPGAVVTAGPAEEGGWFSPAQVIREITGAFSKLDSYRANFSIKTKGPGKNRSMSGTAWYKKGGKMRLNFSKPSGDVIVSDGKTLWIHIKRLNAVGIQSLQLDRKVDKRPLFMSTNGPGLKRLFRKYHTRFKDPNQPEMVDGKRMFILKLSQMVKVGGFSKMTLYVNADNYFIEKAEASNEFGLETTVEFKNIKRNISVKDGFFEYEQDIPGRAVRVTNPLVKESGQ